MQKRGAQLDLPLRRTHGGKRAGAGRPNLSELQGHQRRPKLDSKHPVHVTFKLAPDLPSLRRKDIFRCLRHAVQNARKKGLKIVHFAILSNHVHLILETDQSSLRRPMQSLGISFSKRINRLLVRAGAVLLDRYHLHALKTPTEVRRVLTYVLTNEAKHRHRHNDQLSGKKQAKQQGSLSLVASLDPFSSAFRFRAWRTLMGGKVAFQATSWSEAFIEEWYDEILSEARTWLLRTGWMRGLG